MSEALLNEAWQRHRAGDHSAAERLYKDVLAREPQSFAALYRLGFLYGERGQFADAEQFMGKALALRPASGEAQFLRGSALLQLDRLEEASVCFDAAVALDPALAPAWFNRAVAQLRLGRHAEALASADRSLALAPGNADALVTRGLALTALARKDEAMASYDRALILKPDCADALVHRAALFHQAKRYNEAAADCEAALALDPSLDYLPGALLFFRMSACDWRDLDRQIQAVGAAVRAGKRAVQPWMNLSLSASPEEQLQAARIWAQGECAVSAPALWRGERYRHARVRLAYLSEDFRAHPVAELIAGVLERHDRTRFEVAALALSRNDGSPLRARIAQACDRFEDMSGAGDAVTAQSVRAAEIDIAIDLTGFSGTGRRQILSRRPAPVQASFLGFSGTMGADWIDYAIADCVVAPQDDAAQYREAVVHLPGCFMPVAPEPVVALSPSREEAGLPARGFVFATFNNAYKVAPDIFAVWMRLLTKAEGSTLWLGQINDSARRNLLREAEARGVAPSRLIFAPYVQNRAAHLARLSCADLFLDTVPHNAHSTAADALRAGLPVLTLMGSTFAGRVAASLNRAAGMAELIALSLEAYEHKALSLARNAAHLAALRARLKANSATHALFDIEGYVRHLEAAFLYMHERAQSGLPPASFAVPSPQ